MGVYHTPTLGDETTLDLGATTIIRRPIAPPLVAARPRQLPARTSTRAAAPLVETIPSGPNFSTFPSRAQRIRSIMPAGSPAGAPGVQVHRVIASKLNRPKGQLGDDDQLGGISLKGIGRAIAKGAKDTGKAVKKGVVDTGHVAGAVATSKIGQLATAGILAATGVGLVPAAIIGAGVQGGGELTKKGGNLGKAGRGIVRGGAEGAAGSLVGTGARKLLNRGKPSPSSGQVASALDTANAPLAGPTYVPPQSGGQVAPDLTMPPTNINTAPAAMTADEAKLHASIATDKGNDPFSLNDKTKAAKKAHDSGQAAKKQSKVLADRSRRLGNNADAIAKKAQIAAEAGDALGAGQLADQARMLAALATNTQHAADTAADYSERAGNAIAAGTDAAIGAAGANSESFGNIVAWVEANPGKAAVIGAGTAWLVYKAVKGKAA